MPRNFIIGLAAFLTLADLFATQAILPALAQAYGVSLGRAGCVGGIAASLLIAAILAARLKIDATKGERQWTGQTSSA